MALSISENFLLDTLQAQELYHQHAAGLPIIDYQSGIQPAWVAEDSVFTNVADLFSTRRFCSGSPLKTTGEGEKDSADTDTDAWQRFKSWADMLPYLVGSEQYLLTHLALKMVFGIDTLLNEQTAKTVYDACNEQLAARPLTMRELLQRFGVECVCTTDDPVADLRSHQVAREGGAEVKMLPTWRPDRAVNIERLDFRDYIYQLGQAADVDILRFTDLLEALQRRHDFFAANGCKLSDHRLEEFYDEPYTASQIEIIFEKAMRGQELFKAEARQYKHCILSRMAEMDSDAGWTQQYHYGMICDNDLSGRAVGGLDTGFCAMDDYSTARAMLSFFNRLQQKGKLTRTLLVDVNPSGSDMLCTMAGNFQDAACPGKVQMGIGWWGDIPSADIARQLKVLLRYGLLGRSVGISGGVSSPLSYVRYDYFRRILCRELGNDVVQGLLPHDMQLLGSTVENVCYHNARCYFDFY